MQMSWPPPRLSDPKLHNTFFGLPDSIKHEIIYDHITPADISSYLPTWLPVIWTYTWLYENPNEMTFISTRQVNRGADMKPLSLQQALRKPLTADEHGFWCIREMTERFHVQERVLNLRPAAFTDSRVTTSPVLLTCDSYLLVYLMFYCFFVTKSVSYV